MKNIKNIEDIRKDFLTISNLVQKYSEVINEPRPTDHIPPGHYDGQLKDIQQTITKIRTGLCLAYEGLEILKEYENEIDFRNP